LPLREFIVEQGTQSGGVREIHRCRIRGDGPEVLSARADRFPTGSESSLAGAKRKEKATSGKGVILVRNEATREAGLTSS
jgi:hypothetical protein